MTPQHLRNSILQQAIEGKLVEQRPEEGTAEELYSHIQEEKKKLIAEGKVKKEKPLPEISEEEIPFDIPESWKWVRLNDIVTKEIKRGRSPKYTSKSSTLVFAQKCNSKYDGIRTDLALYLDETIIDKYSEQEFMLDGDIVINSTGGGTMGRVGQYHIKDNKQSLPIVPDSHVTVIRSNAVNNSYLFSFLKSQQSFLEGKGDGSTNQTELKPIVLKNLLFPLPPLEEQKRIVAKIDELLPFIDKYEKAYNALEEYNARFPEDMKKAILQQAIEGKLVEQRKEEGTAEELYSQIQEEKSKLIAEGKIKKEKPLPEITEDEIPFDIPDSWKWVRIGKIFSLQAGKNIKAEKIQETPSDIYPYKCYGGNDIRGYVAEYNHNGDYPIIGRQGALCGNVKRAIGAFYATEHAVCVETFFNTNVAWACYFLTQLNLNQYATATAQPGLAVAKIDEVCIPLPPLAEQKRIVAKIEELLPYCDMLKQI